MSLIANFSEYLTETIIFKNIEKIPDGAGGFTESETSFSKKCYVEQASSNEIANQNLLGNKVTNLVICEYDNRINENTIAEWESKDYSCYPPANACSQDEHMEVLIGS